MISTLAMPLLFVLLFDSDQRRKPKLFSQKLQDITAPQCRHTGCFGVVLVSRPMAFVV